MRYAVHRNVVIIIIIINYYHYHDSTQPYFRFMFRKEFWVPPTNSICYYWDKCLEKCPLRNFLTSPLPVPSSSPTPGQGQVSSLDSFLLLFSLLTLQQPPRKTLSFQPPFSFRIPLFTLLLSSPHSLQTEEESTVLIHSLIHSPIHSKHTELLSCAGPVTGPEDTAVKETRHLRHGSLHQCYTIASKGDRPKGGCITHPFTGKSCKNHACVRQSVGE